MKNTYDGHMLGSSSCRPDVIHPTVAYVSRTYRQDTRMSESPAETDRLWCDFSSVLALLGSIRWGNGFFVSVGLADEPQVWHHSCWLPNDFARIDVLNSFLWRPNKSWLDSSQRCCIYRSSLLERIQTFELCSPEWMTVAIAKSTTRLLSCSLMKSQSTLHIFIVVCTCSCKNTQNTDIWTCFKTYANSEPSWFIVSQNEGSISWMTKLERLYSSKEGTAVNAATL